MKAKVLTLLVAAMIIFNVSYANDTDTSVNQIVLTSFSQQFQKASDIEWIRMDGYYKASFTWNEQHLTAFFGDNGETIALARNIVKKELPIPLQTDLSDEYKGYWVSDLFEYNTSDNTKYYMTIENSDKKIILESMDNSYWEVFKKSNKG